MRLPEPTPGDLRLRRAHQLQAKIAERAEREIAGWNHERQSFIMDLDSVPDLDLEGLLAAPKFDFAHDVCGIVRHMDRSTFPGKLMDCGLTNSKANNVTLNPFFLRTDRRSLGATRKCATR